MRNAFWDLPEIAAADGAAPAHRDGDAGALDDAAGPSLGPKQLVAFEVRSAPGEAWAPYPGEPSLRVLVEEIAQSRRRTSRYWTFDPSAGVTALLAALMDATEKRVLPILLVDPKALGRPEWRAAVASLFRHPWRGGIVVPVDASDQPSIHLMESIKADFEPTSNEREWVVVRVAQGGVVEFRTAVISMADDILARIVEHGSVERSTPATLGPSVRPRIANTLDAQGPAMIGKSAKIITFYSYKGGTGRSMAVANVAWILASNGHDVLLVDWDLEAPGLHRYLRPFLVDPELTSSPGVIDFVWDAARVNVTPADKSQAHVARGGVPVAGRLRRRPRLGLPGHRLDQLHPGRPPGR